MWFRLWDFVDHCRQLFVDELRALAILEIINVNTTNRDGINNATRH